MEIKITGTPKEISELFGELSEVKESGNYIPFKQQEEWKAEFKEMTAPLIGYPVKEASGTEPEGIKEE